MTAIVVGILSHDRIRARVLAIANGGYQPKPTEPKIWFTSMRSLAEGTNKEPRWFTDRQILGNHWEMLP